MMAALPVIYRGRLTAARNDCYARHNPHGQHDHNSYRTADLEPWPRPAIVTQRDWCSRARAVLIAESAGNGAPPVLASQGLEARRGSRGQGRRDFRWHWHVRALEAAERPERSELNVLDQLRPEQRRADAVVELNVGPPPEVRGVRWLNGVLVRLRHDRRDVVDARVFRPYDLQPEPGRRQTSGPGTAACPTTAVGTRPPRRPGRSAGGCPERSSQPWLRSLGPSTQAAQQPGKDNVPGVARQRADHAILRAPNGPDRKGLFQCINGGLRAR